MKKHSSLALACLILASAHSLLAEEAYSSRPPWTTSRITGSPEAPPPYSSERIYEQLVFEQPVEMIAAPTLGGPVVVERRGKMFLLSDDTTSNKRQLFFGGSDEIPALKAVYGLAFHPNFEKNRFCYVCYVLGPEIAKGTRVSRFTVTRGESPRIDPGSEQILLDDWLSGGHNGGCLRFGPDGYLYISTGDASPPDPPDVHDTGQNLTDLLCCILRIDIDRQDEGRNYAIPEDNAFVKVKGARSEIWAYGLRNPWRMSFDRKSGQLWVGDVGWQLWEMIYKIRRGGNYGWAVKEGPQDVRVEAKRGPTPILPPVIALPRSEAASVTGGYVYHGDHHNDLRGAYFYGDYVTGKVWALTTDESGVVENCELARTPHAIICFYESPRGELALVDYRGGTIHRLRQNDVAEHDHARFPQKLSETGLFDDTRNLTPSAGVLPFEINAPAWNDHAISQYLVAVPGDQSISLRLPSERVPLKWGEFPKDTVLVKTISLSAKRSESASSRRVETQILHYSGKNWRGNSGEWYGYSYVWNDNQTDATLAPAEGRELTLQVADSAWPNSTLTHRWRVASRGECYTCHNPWAGYRLAFTPEQLNLKGTKWRGNHQLHALLHKGILKEAGREDRDDESNNADLTAIAALANPHDAAADLAQRARSYLHVNCAHCHRFGGGGSATIDLRFDRTISQMKAISVRPSQGTFEIHDAQIIAPMQPEKSILLCRMVKSGRGHMPQIGPRLIDQQGVELIATWIEQLELENTDQAERKAIQQEQATRARLIAGLRDPQFHGEYTTAVKELLASTSDALALRRAIAKQPLPAPAHQSLLKVASEHAKGHIRDLFEPFFPPEMRVQALGTVIDEAAILELDGNPNAGEELVLRTEGIQCKSCHKFPVGGGELGPDLSNVGKRLNRVQLLESLVQPSRTIAPEYLTHLIETKNGRVHSGLIAERDDGFVVLRVGPKQTVRVSSDEIELITPSQKSMMPELLFRDLTAEELADLLAYLESLK